MPLIDEKGNLFGIVNIVDVLVVLLVLAVLIAGIAVVTDTGDSSDVDDSNGPTTQTIAVDIANQSLESVARTGVPTPSAGYMIP